MAYDPALRRSVVTDLRRIETLRGDVPRCLVEELASDIGAHPSTLWRWLQTDRHHIHHPNSRPRRHPDLTEEHITVVFQHLGNLKAAKAALDATHPEIAAMSESTFRRRWQRIDPAIRAMATQGATGVLDNQIRILHTADERNRIWHLDHQELPVWVLPRGHTTSPVKPWLTTIIDDATRRIMSVLLTVERPGTEHVVVALADGMRRRDLGDGHWAGGVPEIVHSDNGGEFKAVQYRQALTRLGVTRKTTPPDPRRLPPPPRQHRPPTHRRTRPALRPRHLPPVGPHPQERPPPRRPHRHPRPHHPTRRTCRPRHPQHPQPWTDHPTAHPTPTEPATAASPPVTVTVANGRPDHVRFLTSLNDPDRGVVSIRIRPGTRRLGWIIRDILAALGKRHDVTGKGRNDQTHTYHAETWLAAHRIRHLVAAGVETLTTDLAEQLVTLTAGAGIHLWAVTEHTLPAALVDVLTRWPTRPLHQHDFDNRWRHHQETTPRPHQAGEEWPMHVPDSDFPTFLADTRRLLPPDHATTVEHHYTTTVSAALGELDRATRPDEETITRIVRRHLADSPTVPAAVTTLRAVQTACFHRGWHLQVDVATLLARGDTHLHAAAHHPDTWRRLRAYHQPYRGAVCAAVAAGLDLDGASRLTIADIDPDGRHITSPDGQILAVPTGADLYLRALHTQRTLDGAPPDAPFLADHTDTPIGPRNPHPRHRRRRHRSRRRPPLHPHHPTPRRPQTVAQPPRHQHPTPPPATMSLLDRDLIRRRRRGLHLSQRALAKHLGVSPVVVAALEEGTNHPHLSLDLFHRLADTLAVDPHQLLHHHPKAEPAETGDEAEDVERLAADLGAMLTTLGVLTSVDALADATGQPLPAVEAALHQLDAALRPAGLHLHRHGRDVAIRPTANLDPQHLQRLYRRHHARRGLNHTEARILHQALTGTLDETRLSNPETVALNRLRNAGLVTEESQPQLSVEVAASLYPDHE